MIWRPALTPEHSRTWANLRQQKPVTFADLRVEHHPWLRRLIQAGYIAETASHLTLTKNTGPLPPLARRDGSIYDPNLAGEIELWQLALWRGLRAQKTATTASLRQIAQGRNLIDLRVFISALFKAGWIRKTHRGHQVYWAANQDRPYPLFMTCRNKRNCQLFDPTTGEVTHEY